MANYLTGERPAFWLSPPCSAQQATYQGQDGDCVLLLSLLLLFLHLLQVSALIVLSFQPTQTCDQNDESVGILRDTQKQFEDARDKTDGDRDTQNFKKTLYNLPKDQRDCFQMRGWIATWFHDTFQNNCFENVQMMKTFLKSDPFKTNLRAQKC